MKAKFLTQAWCIFLSFLLLLCGPQGIALALPEGGVVVAGSATFTQPSASTMNINTSDKVAINYNSFNINTAETVNFIQPSSSSIALNRVVGVDPSSILGSLNANGQVFLINPNGIIFGPGANINVHGLVASTLDITNQNFLSSNFKFVQDPAKALGAISNLGVITATGGGYAVLAAPSVSNSGVIQANLGTIALGSTEGFTLSLSADNLISFALDTAVSKQLSSYLDNKGTLKADSGTILVEAKVAEEIVDAVVNNDGLIEANTIVKDREGNIKLTTTTALANSGTIRANASDYTKAGNIEATSGKTLTLAPTSRVEAKGKDIESTGGNVYLYSNKDAIAQAGQTIDISGGTVSGDGGWAELSSAGNMQLGGKFVGFAQTGYKRGAFIIDPPGLDISVPIDIAGSDLLLTDSGYIWHHLGGDVLDSVGGGSFTGQAGTNYRIDSGVNIAVDNNIEIRANNDITTAGNLTSANGSIIFAPDYDSNMTGDLTMTGGKLWVQGGSGNIWLAYVSGGDILTFDPATDAIYMPKDLTLSGGDIVNDGTGLIVGAAYDDVNLEGTNVTGKGSIAFVADMPTLLNALSSAFAADGNTGDLTMTGGTIQTDGANSTILLGSGGDHITLAGGEVINSGAVDETSILIGARKDINLTGTNLTSATGRIQFFPNLLNARGVFNMSGGNVVVGPTSTKNIDIGWYIQWFFFWRVDWKIGIPVAVNITGGSMTNQGTGDIHLMAYDEMNILTGSLSALNGEVILDFFGTTPHLNILMATPDQESEERKEEKKIGQTITQFKCATIRLR
ncbi:MAG: filamentous hemagglutinin N-terminal domain-containing protein [Candidatus Omnitrophica bacterium]|nr:filamentous hemagglutinin N-terminal domain-containing protein [Candidatus Omnitrophota bacterium]